VEQPAADGRGRLLPHPAAGAVSDLHHQPDPAHGGDRAARRPLVRLRPDAEILLVALVTFFPMLVALVEGYAATEKELEDLLGSMGASRWRRFLLARLPSSLPYFFAGLRIAITYAVVGAIFAEYAGSAKGLGIYILNAKNNFRADLMLAAVMFSSVLTLLLFGATLLLQRFLAPWIIETKGARR
jgi:ABC-type nitrate/sulfonate/bicarbonate transport system permease component